MTRDSAITKAQVQKIKVMQRRLGLSDDDYRLMLWSVGGVKSCTELKGAAVTRVMEHLMRCLGEIPPGPPLPKGGTVPAGPAVLRATQYQIDLLLNLWAQVSTAPSRAREMALRNWLRRTVQVNHEKFLTRDQAQRAIEGLKVMAARRKHAQAS